MVTTVAPGDHACGVFASDDDQAQLVGGFARDAFARGDRLFYIADASDEGTIVDFLDDVGLEGRARLDAGDLQILHSSQMGLEDGFDRDRQLAAWQELIDTARDDGYRGLAGAVEMTWALAWDVEPEAVVAYEATAGELFAGGGLSALCQYDTRRFERNLVKRAAHVHPYAIAVRGGDCKLRFRRLSLARSAASDVLELGGEIDFGNLAFLEAQIAEAVVAGDVVLDCSDLDFVDIGGCRLLYRLTAGEPDHGHVELRNPPPVVRRVLNLLTWVEG
jgi:anti-anti-sigma regulatory factor